MDRLLGRKPLTRWNIVGLIILILGIWWLLSQMSAGYYSPPFDGGNDLYAVPQASALRVVSNPFAAVQAFIAPSSVQLAAEASSSGSGGGGPDVEAAEPAQSPNGVAAQTQLERLIVRSGLLTLIVDDPRAARIAVEQLVAEMAGEGAFIVTSSEQASGSDSPPTVSMVFRVPVARFDEAMNRTAELAKDVLVRTTTAQDVTEEYVDLQAKLQSLEVARDRLLQILEEAKTTKDLLEIEKQLADRNAEIDSIKARLQYLEQTASLSSIQVDFRPSVASQTVIPGWHPDDTARQAIERLIQRFQNTIDWWIAFAIADLPWLLFYGLIIFVVARVTLRWWRKRNPAKPAVE